MEKLYFALVSTPGLFAAVIRQVIGIQYCHVAVSLDAELQNAYSFNRRNPEIPYFSGFVREDTDRILRKFPNAQYKILSIPCTAEQKERIQETLELYYERRFQYHYCIIGLPFVLFGKPFYQNSRYTCSSFAARLLDAHDIPLFQKHFSLVTPRDYDELAGVQVEYEGLLRDYVQNLALGWKGRRAYGT